MTAAILALLIATAPLGLEPVGPWQDGTATWYCLPGRSTCTAGFPAEGMFAALSPDFGIAAGARVEVCRGDRCVAVRVIDECSECGRNIDLYASVFKKLASLGAGRIDITLRAIQPGVFGQLAVARGHRALGTSPYRASGTLIVTKGEYVTIRADVGPELAGRPIEFWQRNGKSGEWVRRTIGRVDAAGFVYWSTRPPMLRGTGFARYVYYRARFRGTSTIDEAWSADIGRVVVVQPEG
jgi:hypothetical protein